MPGRRRLARWACGAAASTALLLAPAQAAAEPGPRIVGGKNASIATYPWQAALVYDADFGLDDLQGQFCGGSLITPRIVQTAAHCVDNFDPDDPPPDPGGDGTDMLDPNDVDVVLGKTTLTAGGGERHDVDEIYMDAFNPLTFDNDYAFLVLTTASAQTPIKVAGAGEAELWEPHRLTEVSGWGNTSQGGVQSDTLQVATVPIIDDTVCGQPGVYGSDFHAATMVCAGLLGGGIDSCQGDSGGPLQAPAAGTDPPFRLVGSVSWGTGCAQPDAPGVYARIADYPGGLQSRIDAIETLESITDPTMVTGTGATVPPLTNDSFSTPIPISPGTVLVANNLGATAEPGEPAHGGAGGGHSVWFSWTAGSSGTAIVSLCGSNLNTLLGVYTGGAVNALTPIAGSDDACGSSSQSSFAAIAGTTYRVAVDGFLGDEGAFRLGLSLAPDVAPPPPPKTKKKKCRKGKKLRKGKCVKKKKKKKKPRARG